MDHNERKVIPKIPEYRVLKPKSVTPSIPTILKRHKNENSSRQLAIYADERNGRSGLKKLRCIVTCYKGMPSILTVFDDSGRKIRACRLKKDYSEHMPHKDALSLARIKPYSGIPVIVERF